MKLLCCFGVLIREDSYCITGRKPEKEKTPPVPQEGTEAEGA